MSSRYNHREIEPKWRARWAEAGIDRALSPEQAQGKKKAYVLEMFPYPSGRIHVGHSRNYTMGDVIARFRRSNGYNVLQKAWSGNAPLYSTINAVFADRNCYNGATQLNCIASPEGFGAMPAGQPYYPITATTTGSPFRWGMVTGVISFASRPFACAAAAFSCERTAKASCSSRVNCHWRAMFSAVMPI